MLENFSKENPNFSRKDFSEKTCKIAETPKTEVLEQEEVKKVPPASVEVGVEVYPRNSAVHPKTQELNERKARMLKFLKESV